MDQQAPTLDEIEQIARDTVAALPRPFAAAAADVALRVLDMPGAQMLAELGMDDPLELTGLYEGVPMTQKSVTDPPAWPDAVWLFRRPILAELETRPEVSLAQLVAHVTIHEFAHHFGWSDDDIASIDRWWE